MRILFLITSSLDYPYGQGRCAPLARVLVGAGHEVSIAALHPALGSVRARSFHDQGVDVRYVGPMHVRQVGDERHYYSPAGLGWAVARGTAGLVLPALFAHADVIHLGKPHPMNGLAGLLGKWLRGRRLYLDCDDYEAESNRLGGTWQKRVLSMWEDGLPRFAQGITVNTRFTQQRIEALGYPAERMAYLPNGVDETWLAPPPAAQVEQLRCDWKLAGRRVVGYVGSLSLSSHAVGLLLESMAQICARCPDVVLLIVGGGEDYQRVRAMAAELGLAQAVRFTGHVPAADVPAYYALADVTVDPVHDDQVARARCPLKIVQSLAAGKPVVTGDVGERRELLDDGRAGVLVPPGDASALADGLSRVLDNPELRHSLAQGALVHRCHYMWRDLVGPLLALYEAKN